MIRRLFPLLLLVLTAVGAPPALAAASLADLSFQPHPGADLPLLQPFRDEQNRAVTLATYFTGKPVVLVLEYLRCKTLCGLTLEILISNLDSLPLSAGRDYQLVAISIDPRDDAAAASAAKSKYLASYHHTGGTVGLHFLTGSDAAVHAVAQAVGFRYRYDPDLDQYIHPAGFVVAAPDGRISRYLFGVAADPGELNEALTDAARGQVLNPLTRLLLLCHIQGLPIGRYSLPIEGAFVLANIAAIAALIATFAMIWRRRKG
jgi:protein SCO1/2